MIGVGRRSVEPTQLGHELIWKGIVVLDALDRVVELGTALVGGGEPHWAVQPEEALAQVAELDVPIDGGREVSMPSWQVVAQLAHGSHEIELEGVGRGLQAEVMVAEEV